MSTNALFTPTYFNQLYETMKHLSLKEIKNLCQSNKEISTFCRDNRLVQQMLKEKPYEDIIRRMQDYIQKTGNIDLALDYANNMVDVKVVIELLKRGADINYIKDPTHSDIVEYVLKNPSISNQLSRTQLNQYSDLSMLFNTIKYLELNDIVNTCNINRSMHAICKNSPYIRNIIKQKTWEIKYRDYDVQYRRLVELFGINVLNQLGIHNPDYIEYLKSLGIDTSEHFEEEYI